MLEGLGEPAQRDPVRRTAAEAGSAPRADVPLADAPVRRCSATGRGPSACITRARQPWNVSSASSPHPRRAPSTRRCCRPRAEPASDGVTDGRLPGPALVGRASERAELSALWRASERGRAQLVLVTGEPGIGKTRLVEELPLLVRPSWRTHGGGALVLRRGGAGLRSGGCVAALGGAHGPSRPGRPGGALGARSAPARARWRARAGLRRAAGPELNGVSVFSMRSSGRFSCPRRAASAGRRRCPVGRRRDAAVPPLPAAIGARGAAPRCGNGATRGARPERPAERPAGGPAVARVPHRARAAAALASGDGGPGREPLRTPLRRAGRGPPLRRHRGQSTLRRRDAARRMDWRAA